MGTGNLRMSSMIMTDFCWLNPSLASFLLTTEWAFLSQHQRVPLLKSLGQMPIMRINVNLLLANYFTGFSSDHISFQSPCCSLCFSRMHLFLFLQIIKFFPSQALGIYCVFPSIDLPVAPFYSSFSSALTWRPQGSPHLHSSQSVTGLFHESHLLTFLLPVRPL